MRPESIKKFDILYLASILVGMIGTIMNFSSIEVQAAGTMLTPTTPANLLHPIAYPR